MQQSDNNTDVGFITAPKRVKSMLNNLETRQRGYLDDWELVHNAAYGNLYNSNVPARTDGQFIVTSKVLNVDKANCRLYTTTGVYDLGEPKQLELDFNSEME